MLSLDDLPEWAPLDCAFGDGTRAPPRIRAVLAREHGAWEALFHELTHQSTIYSAAYVALPHVAPAAAALPLGPDFDWWLLFGVVARCGRTPPPALRADFAAGMRAALRAMLDAMPTLGTLPPGSRWDVVVALAAVAGFVDEARAIAVDDAVIPIRCGSCRAKLFVDVDAGVVGRERDLAAHADGTLEPGRRAKLTTIAPWSGPVVPGDALALASLDFDEVELAPWLIATLRLAGVDTWREGARLCHFAGTASCPKCKEEFSPMEERSWD